MRIALAPMLMTMPMELSATIELNTSTPKAAKVLRTEYFIASIVFVGLFVLLMYMP